MKFKQQKKVKNQFYKSSKLLQHLFKRKVMRKFSKILKVQKNLLIMGNPLVLKKRQNNLRAVIQKVGNQLM